MKNYFQILQLTEEANAHEIRQAYRRLAKQYHPDVNKAADAQEKFCEITEAYEFLMGHWPQRMTESGKTRGYDTKYREYQQTDAYEQFIHEARERARRQARMRYEKFKKQHEAFQESGLNDLALIFTIFMRLTSVLLFLFFFLTPVILTFIAHWVWIFVIFFMWPFAIGIAWYYHDNRKNYFRPGEFYYTADRLRHIFTDKHETHIPCYYSKNRTADSRPYKLELLKLKDVKIGSGGFRQHNVNYVNKDYSILIPRSHKAFMVHIASMLIKVLSIAAGLIFLEISSITWRFLLGIATGGILSRILLLLLGTKSNVSYLFSYGMIIRIAVWITAIAFASRFYFSPFDIYTTDFIHFVIFAIAIFDAFLMQILSLVLGKISSYPVFSQYPETGMKFREGYIVYNDIPVISFLYPVFKWIFG